MGSTQSIRKGFLAVVLCAAACLMLLFMADHALAMATGSDLGAITMDKSVLWAPGRLAVGGDGTLYVVDSYKNHILKFDRGGNYLGDIKFSGVSSIAVASDGTLYIGSHKDYSVTIYRNGQAVGYLGSGANEFRSVRDIAVNSATGWIYVVDNIGNAVRIFDAAGNDQGTIANVSLPVSIEISDGWIYVIDASQAQGWRSMTTTSQVLIFNSDHAFVTAIDGNLDQYRMHRPTDLGVANGLLYVTDAVSKSVLVFDLKGAYQGEIRAAGGDFNMAVSLAFSPDGLLYVSSSETRSIHVFAANAGGLQ